jgi:hypothetical protein
LLSVHRSPGNDSFIAPAAGSPQALTAVIMFIAKANKLMAIMIPHSNRIRRGAMTDKPQSPKIC